MKFLHYAALIASTAAVRLTTTQKTSLASLINVDKHVPNPEEMWRKFDTNGDGEWDLSETENAVKSAAEYFEHGLPENWKDLVKAEFAKADKDNSGKVSSKEMLVYLFELIDENDDGSWSRKEVYDAIENLARLSRNELVDDWKTHIDDAFDSVDADSDGKATAKEVMAALKEHGVPDINDLFKRKEERLKLSHLISATKDIPNPEDVWKEFDTDKSNSWDLGETKKAFKATMKYFGHKLPADWKKAVKREFKKADSDNSGAVTPKEMGVYLFKLVDENDDGHWSLLEVKQAIRALAKFSGNKLKKDAMKDVKKVFKTVDTDSDGKATPKEIFAALEKHGIPDINALFE